MHTEVENDTKQMLEKTKGGVRVKIDKQEVTGLNRVLRGTKQLKGGGGGPLCTLSPPFNCFVPLPLCFTSLLSKSLLVLYIP